MEKGYTILLVDDHAPTLLMLESHFLNKYNIISASNGKEALSLLRDYPFPEKVAFVISDQQMPIMNGIEFLKILRIEFPNIVRILFTAYADKDTMLNAINEAQVFHYFQKPVSLKEVEYQSNNALNVFKLKKERISLVSALKREKTILEQSEEMAKQGSWKWDLKTNEIEVSKQFRKIFQLTTKQCLNKIPFILKNLLKINIPVKDIRNINDLVSEALKNSTIKNNEFKISIKNKIIFVKTKAKVINDSKNRPQKIVGFVQNITQQKKVAEALQESEKKFDIIFKEITDVILITDNKGNFIYSSPNPQKMYGLDITELMLLSNINNLFKDHNLDISEILKKKEIKNIERIFIDKNQIKHNILIDAKVVNFENIEIIYTTREITNLRNKEKALRENEHIYQNIVNSLSEGIILYNKKGIVETCNNSASKIIGWSQSKIISSSVEDISKIAHEKNGVPYNLKNCPIQITLKKGISQKDITVGIKKNNSRLTWLLFNTQPIFNDKTKQLKWVVASFLDITNLKTTQSELQISEEKFRKISTSAHDGIMMLNDRGIISFWNNSASKIFGFSSQEILGEKFQEKIIPEKYLSITLKKILGYCKEVSKQEGHITEIIALNKEKEEIIVELSITPIILENRWNAIAIIRNITQRKQVEKQLQEALLKEKDLNRLKSNFVSMVSHQFRTPLTTIKSSIQIMELFSEELSPQIKNNFESHYKRIHNEVDRINELMEDVLTLGSVEAKKISTKFTKIDLIELINSILKQRFNMIFKVRKTIFTYKGNVEKIEADENLLIHIISNLLSNAYKYSTGNPSLLLLFDKKTIKLILKDNGIGIPLEEQKNLFRSFFRATNTENISGTGLGLVIVKEFVEWHNGTITFNSKEKEGTCFIVELPKKQSNENTI